MNHELKFNILGLEKSIFNKDIENLQKQILDSIPKSLQHACLYWAEYYSGVNVNDETSINCLMEFLQEHLLHWLETLSILTATHQAGPLLRIAEISIQQSHSQISQTLNEGCRLVDLFYLPIGESCTGLYSTILTFCPKECRLAGLYKKKYQHNIQVKEGGLRDWPKNLSILQGHQSSVTSVGFSLDGTKIVSGSWDNTVRLLWDACTGQSLGQPLEGHQQRVTSVGFSPDGTKIVSGSWDNTVRLWDACTGQSLGQPLEGHQDGVTSVGFSSDGTKIVSGSLDRTVKSWDPNIAAGPLVQLSQLFHKTSWRFDIDSGWIYTIFLQTDVKVPIAWVPEDLRSGLHTPLTQCVFGAYQTVLDFSNYLPWEKWTF
ncbi:hypothetical protein M422DRAFT_192788 [Sphaerobolus stellatus SS14]|uniref:Unplaced genomic scaffold SPHSTscaffold_313, whole genome shotgun sequence n=1 Tax=Sphaerobolus stellatus (strain SS14) TaxID=990650 RepID=A0A0C9UL93_SPHS4|nr:hypothetical protein M422DRAFT_192788 [Sphaerobolus stellatus SS14]